MRRLHSVTGGSYQGPGLVTVIITVTNIAAGQNISITKHISDHRGITGMCRLMAHCYHPEERHHSLKMTQTMGAKCDDVAIKSLVMSPSVIMT